MDINFKVSPADFLAMYQEQKPLLMKGCVQANAISWQDINQIITRRDVMSDDFKLSLNGILPKSEYVESYMDVGTLRHRLNKAALYGYLRQGATLIDNKIVGEPHFDHLAKQIANYCGRQTVVSSYAAFGEKDSFRNHWDTRDVFVIQLIGRKRWTVYPPSFENPLYMQQSKDLEQQYPCPDKPFMDFILEAGDVFYLPRGWWHNPMPVGEQTFHLAVGTFPAYAMNYVEWLMAKLPDCTAARHSLSHWQQDKAVLHQLAAHLSESLHSADSYRDFLDNFYAAQRLPSSPAIDIFGNPAVHELPDNTLLSMNANKAHGLFEGYVVANGMKVSLDAIGKDIISTIEQEKSIRFIDLIQRLSGFERSRVAEIIWNLCRLDILSLSRRS